MRTEKDMRKAVEIINYGAFTNLLEASKTNPLVKMGITDALYSCVDAAKEETTDSYIEAAQAILALNRAARSRGNEFIGSIIQNREGAINLVNSFLYSLERYYWETTGEMLEVA